ncbi:WD domain, G-beta repeat protein, partial [Ostertagia ostertagi]
SRKCSVVSLLSEESCPSGSRAATFRHIFGQSVQRSEWFDWGAALGSNVAANPKFVAVAIDGGAGGQNCGGSSARMMTSGKHGRIGLVRLQDHTIFVQAQCVRTLVRHSRRVDQIEWHTTVDNVLLSAGADSKLFLWDVEANSVIYEISDFCSSCIAFAPNSSIFAATSRQSHRVCIFDARNGNAMKSAVLPHDGGMPPKVCLVSTSLVEMLWFH